MYVYLIQPRDCMVGGAHGNIYKIGMSSKEDLSRLRSYGCGTRYICMVEVENYLETERQLKSAFGDAFQLHHGHEYYTVDNEEKAVSLFMTIVTKMRATKCDQDQFTAKLATFAYDVRASRLKTQPSATQVDSDGEAKQSTFMDKISRFKISQS